MLISSKPKSPTRRSLVISRLLCVIAIFSFTYYIGTQDAVAQIDGGGIGGGGIDGGGTDFGDFGGLDNFGGDSGTGGDAGVFDQSFGGEETVNERVQGFVGSTSTSIQENGFIGSPGDTDGSFGGGTNNVGSTGGGGGARGGRNNQNRNTGFGGTGEVKGFQVSRSSVRANLRPRFSYPQVNGNQVANRFQNRIRRLPNMANVGTGVQISIANRTATIQGFVSSAEELNRIERQLRLEPGVYRINNQAQVTGQ